MKSKVPTVLTSYKKNGVLAGYEYHATLQSQGSETIIVDEITKEEP